jgi:ComF family protein
MSPRLIPTLPLTHALSTLVEFIYPSTCFVCDALMDAGESRVCASCWISIQDVTAEDPLYLEMQKRLTESSRISKLISLYHFEKDGTLQSIIHQLKYEGMTKLGVELGRKLGQKLLAELINSPLDGIVPVPLHPTKLRERSYNQSEFVARGIRDVTGLPVYTSLLKRHKYTSSQTQLNAAERKENVGDAFSVNKRYLLSVEGKTFLIVDDVITTGSTIEACAEVLMSAGAQRAVACAVAIADHSV